MEDKSFWTIPDQRVPKRRNCDEHILILLRDPSEKVHAWTGTREKSVLAFTINTFFNGHAINALMARHYTTGASKCPTAVCFGVAKTLALETP
ncbi:hypothetical protein AVEN_272424-1 [Araneus ventricosus]|uniref:Uncharacterized protein n=1 Tax=Araneus ventricosus TaxID=182803 RepID=A0A4Y2IYZ1_ARAVE|nr:hypothetical protein AVEN_272424-1 [Araneus ventricosus]